MLRDNQQKRLIKLYWIYVLETVGSQKINSLLLGTKTHTELGLRDFATHTVEENYRFLLDFKKEHNIQLSHYSYIGDKSCKKTQDTPIIAKKVLN